MLELFFLFFVALLLMRKINLSQIMFFIVSVILIYLSQTDISEDIKYMFVFIILTINFSIILFNVYWSYKSE
jgi:hypothetical protein